MHTIIVIASLLTSCFRFVQSKGVSNDGNELLPQSEGRLNVEIAKSRVRGPHGRRLPRKPSHRRTDGSPQVQIQSVRATVEKQDDTTDDEQIIVADDERNEDTSKRKSLQLSDDHPGGSDGDVVSDDSVTRAEIAGTNRSTLSRCLLLVTCL